MFPESQHRAFAKFSHPTFTKSSRIRRHSATTNETEGPHGTTEANLVRNSVHSSQVGSVSAIPQLCYILRFPGGIRQQAGADRARVLREPSQNLSRTCKNHTLSRRMNPPRVMKAAQGYPWRAGRSSSTAKPRAGVRLCQASHDRRA